MNKTSFIAIGISIAILGISVITLQNNIPTSINIEKLTDVLIKDTMSSDYSPIIQSDLIIINVTDTKFFGSIHAKAIFSVVTINPLEISIYHEVNSKNSEQLFNCYFETKPEILTSRDGNFKTIITGSGKEKITLPFWVDINYSVYDDFKINKLSDNIAYEPLYFTSAIVTLKDIKTQVIYKKPVAMWIEFPITDNQMNSLLMNCMS